MVSPFFCFAQDSIQTVKSEKEQKELKFQEHFFKALSEKSIKNYFKAIESLELCNDLIPENVSVYFEFSKNYLFLNKTKEAKDYIRKALDIEPNNVWMLDHLVSIYKKERNFSEAITVQKKVIQINPKKREHLVRLYYLNREYTAAIELMNVLEKESGLSKNLKHLKRSLEYRKGPVVNKPKKEDLASLVKEFDDNQTSFNSLKKILEKAIVEDKTTLHKYSKMAIELFPAQPFSYLMRGKSLQIQNLNNEAIAILESGIDFVIDNPTLEADFYDTIADSYKELSNSEKESEYRNKAKKLRNIK